MHPDRGGARNMCGPREHAKRALHSDQHQKAAQSGREKQSTPFLCLSVRLRPCLRYSCFWQSPTPPLCSARCQQKPSVSEFRRRLICARQQSWQASLVEPRWPCRSSGATVHHTPHRTGRGSFKAFLDSSPVISIAMKSLRMSLARSTCNKLTACRLCW